MFIGSIITIITGIIIFSIQSVLKYILNRKGNLNIYYKHVNSNLDSKPMGKIKETKNSYKIIVPLWIEIHNTKEIKQVIRNLNLLAFYKNKEVDSFTQLNHYSDARLPYANNGSYSFIIESNDIKHYELLFVLYSENKIDELKVRYFDKKDKKKLFSLIKFDDDMKNGYQNLNKEWQKLRNKNK